MPVQRGGPRTQFTVWITADIFYSVMTQVYFGKRHGLPVRCRLRMVVDAINKAHPLVPRTVGVDRTSPFAGRLVFNPVAAGLRRVIWVQAL